MTPAQIEATIASADTGAHYSPQRIQPVARKNTLTVSDAANNHLSNTEFTSTLSARTMTPTGRPVRTTTFNGESPRPAQEPTRYQTELSPDLNLPTAVFRETILGDASSKADERDHRSHAQRKHEALLRGALGDPILGRHNGGTAGGTLLPIKDLIRMVAHSYYLALVEGITGRTLWLGRTKPIASSDQRLVLHAQDRGRTSPGYDIPGYLCEVHHVDEWSTGGPTDIDNLTSPAASTINSSTKSGKPAGCPAAAPTGYPRRN